LRLLQGKEADFEVDAVAEAIVDDGFHTWVVSMVPEEDSAANKAWAEFIGVVYQPDRAIVKGY
jgi:hypothetical protein